MVTIISSSRYRINRLRIKGTVNRVLLENNRDKTQINLVIIGKKKMRELSNKYKHEDVALPVLSFPLEEQLADGNRFIGEVYICFPQAVLLAAERNKKVDDMMTELIEHGVKNLLK